MIRVLAHYDMAKGRSTESVPVPEVKQHVSRAGSAGQSGDTQGLATDATVDSQSVQELVEEGQSFEAAVVSGIENAPDADAGQVRTRQVSEEDVPTEYLKREKEN